MVYLKFSSSFRTLKTTVFTCGIHKVYGQSKRVVVQCKLHFNLKLAFPVNLRKRRSLSVYTYVNLRDIGT